MVGSRTNVGCFTCSDRRRVLLRSGVLLSTRLLSWKVAHEGLQARTVTRERHGRGVARLCGVKWNATVEQGLAPWIDGRDVVIKVDNRSSEFTTEQNLPWF